MFGASRDAMKNVVILAMNVVVLVGCSSSRWQPTQQSLPTQASIGPPDQPLFLHLLAPRTYTNPTIPAHRIVTTRVYPFQDFAIFVGHPENPSTNHWVGAWTNPLWSKTGTAEVRPLAHIWDSGDAVLAGRIERLNEKFVAHLQARIHTSLDYFHGEIELEKPVYEQGGMYQADGIWGVWFALSRNPDCTHFEEALDKGRLDRHLLDKQDPMVKR